MSTSNSMRWLVVVAGAVMLLAVVAACSSETIEVPGETVVVKEEVIKTVEVPGETVVKEVVKEVMVPGETVVVEKVVTETVEVPGETVVVEKEVVKTVEVPGETVTVEVVKEVQVPGETVVVEKEVVKTVEVPGETIVVEKEVVKTVEVPGQTVVVEKVVVQEVPGKKYVTDPTTGKTVSAPQYGGTITWAAKAFPASTDNWWNTGWAQAFTSGVNETLAFSDWAISRDTFDLFGWDRPAEYSRGALAESWSMPDDTTFIWNIRKGVYFENKVPVNGREFDAYDVEWNYHRYLGLGDFTEDGPAAAASGITQGIEIESVTATDKWTVEIKLAKPVLDVLSKMLNSYFDPYPPEVIEKYGDYKDWRNVVGTGPLRLTDVVEGSSATWEKNPNYWGFDEKYPENRLPYIDEYRSLLMPDMSARLAALRTGKIDYMGRVGDANIFSVDDLEALQRTNPEIEVWFHYGKPQGGFLFNWALPPVDDPIVRKALQMAVDREKISATYFKGLGDPTPGGLYKQGDQGYSWPYEDWPEDVKKGYMYDPAGAEALLDAAGYPRGADGYRFKVSLALHDRYDPTYPEILMGYYDAIGVESELVMQTGPESTARNNADTAEWHILSGGYMWEGSTAYIHIQMVVQNIGWGSYNKANDPRMEALYLAAKEALDIEEYKSILRQADEITVREHWGPSKSVAPIFSVNQPWVIGFNGEGTMGRDRRNTFFARLWIDSELKEAMGR